MERYQASTPSTSLGNYSPCKPLAALESDNSHAVKVVIVPMITIQDGALNNLMTNRKITPATAGFGATRVGDGKLFGIDGARPLHEGDSRYLRVFRSIWMQVSTDTTTNCHRVITVSTV